MLTGIAVALIIFAAVFFLIFNLFRNLMKAITITLIIMFLLGVLVGYLIVSDAKEFSSIINENETTYLLVEGDTIRSGFQAHRLNISTFKSIEKNDIEEIRENPPGKVFLINKEILDLDINIPELNTMGLDIDVMFESNSADMRARAFALALGKTIEEEGTFQMVLYIKEGNITIEPKTPVVYVVTSTPRQLYKQAKGLVLKETSKRLNIIREEVSI